MSGSSRLVNNNNNEKHTRRVCQAEDRMDAHSLTTFRKVFFGHYVTVSVKMKRHEQSSDNYWDHPVGTSEGANR